MNSVSPQSSWRLDLRAVVIAGFVAGTIDIGSAALINGQAPGVILQAIASGVLGSASFSEGARSEVLGLGLQWMMALIIAALYVAAANLLPVFRRAWVKGGLLSGVVIFAVMNYVVVPLSAVGRAPRFSAPKFCENLVAMFIFGLIIAYCARRDAAPRSA